MRPQHLIKWAEILGVMATVFGAIQYLPQIWTTYCERDVGSLSIPMMLIQTPGSFLFATSLAMRLGIKGWSSWGLFLVTGTLQGGLLTMGIIFEIRKRQKGISGNDEVRPNHAFRHWLADFSIKKTARSHQDFPRIHIETDDEGSPFVEDGLSERTPLINGSTGTKRTSRSRTS